VRRDKPALGHHNKSPGTQGAEKEKKAREKSKKVKIPTVTTREPWKRNSDKETRRSQKVSLMDHPVEQSGITRVFRRAAE